MVSNRKVSNNSKNTSKVMSSFEKLVILCDCEHAEHQFILVRDPEDGEVWLEPHLVQYDNFFKRLWTGLKYAFGHKSRYGEFDCVMISKKDQEKIVEFLKADHK